MQPGNNPIEHAEDPDDDGRKALYESIQRHASDDSTPAKTERLYQLIRSARSFPLFVHMFVSFHRVVLAAGVAFGLTNAPDPDDDDAPTPAEIQYAQEFAEITPLFRVAIEVCKGDHECLLYLANQLDAAKTRARQNDCNRVRENILRWYLIEHGGSPLGGSDDSVPDFYQPIDAMGARETTRGFNHPDTAYFLCPHGDIPEFLEDPVTFMNDVCNGQRIITDEDFPEFCFALDSRDNSQGFTSYGHLMGVIPRMVLRCIIIGPTKVFDYSPNHSSRARTYNVESVTAPMVGYAIVMAHQALSALENFSISHKGFNYLRCYETVLDDLNDRTESFTKDVLGGFNSVFPEFGNFPNGRRRRAVPRSLPTDNLQTFDTAAKRRAERQSNGYVPIAERNAATILKGVPYRQAVEKRARGIRGKNSTDYVGQLKQLDYGFKLNFDSKPAAQPQPALPPRNGTHSPPPGIPPHSPPHKNDGHAGAASEDDFYVSDLDMPRPTDDDDDLQLAQVLQEQKAMEKRAKELRGKIHARVIQQQVAKARKEATADADQIATWAHEKARDELDKSLASDCSPIDLQRALVEAGNAVIKDLNDHLTTIEDDYQRYSQKVESLVKTAADADLCEIWEDKIKCVLERQAVFQMRVAREEEDVAAIKRDRNLEKYLAKHGDMERRRASTRLSSQSLTLIRSKVIKNTHSQSVKENIDPKARPAGGAKRTHVSDNTVLTPQQDCGLETNPTVPGSNGHPPAKRPRLSDPAITHQPLRPILSDDIQADLQQKATRRTDKFTVEARCYARKVQEDAKSDAHTMILNVGLYAIEQLRNNIESLQKRACGLNEEYSKYFKLGDNDMMHHTNRKLVYAELLVQALRNRSKKEEELTERIRQDPGLDEEYEESDFPEIRDSEREVTEQEAATAAASLQNSPATTTAAQKTKDLEDAVFGGSDSELSCPESEAELPLPKRLVITLPASSSSMPPRTARKEAVNGGSRPIADASAANENSSVISATDPPSGFAIALVDNSIGSLSAHKKAKKGSGSATEPRRQSTRTKKN